MNLSKAKDILLVGGVAAALIALWWFYLPVWGMFFLAIGIVLAVTEITSRVLTGMTISQHFWVFSKRHRRSALALLASLALVITLLIWHLAVKM